MPITNVVIYIQNSFFLGLFNEQSKLLVVDEFVPKRLKNAEKTTIEFDDTNHSNRCFLYEKKLNHGS